MWGEASSVSSRQGSVDLHGDFVARNLENTVFVELPLDYEFADTSHATPIAAPERLNSYLAIQVPQPKN